MIDIAHWFFYTSGYFGVRDWTHWVRDNWFGYVIGYRI